MRTSTSGSQRIYDVIAPAGGLAPVAAPRSAWGYIFVSPLALLEDSRTCRWEILLPPSGRMMVVARLTFMLGVSWHHASAFRAIVVAVSNGNVPRDIRRHAVFFRRAFLVVPPPLEFFSGATWFSTGWRPGTVHRGGGQVRRRWELTAEALPRCHLLPQHRGGSADNGMASARRPRESKLFFRYGI